MLHVAATDQLSWTFWGRRRAEKPAAAVEVLALPVAELAPVCQRAPAQHAMQPERAHCSSASRGQDPRIFAPKDTVCLVAINYQDTSMLGGHDRTGGGGALSVDGVGGLRVVCRAVRGAHDLGYHAKN